METNMTKEIWKQIPGFDGYDVSNQGRVRSYYKLIGWPGGHVLTDKPQRILRGAYKSIGYHYVLLALDGKSYNKMTHQLMMLAFNGPCPDGMEVCHNDSNPKNNRLDNLRYDTKQGNTNDRCKLTEEQITEVRYRCAAMERVQDIAKEYGVSRNSIIRICTGESFSLLGGGPITDLFSLDNGFTKFAKVKKVAELMHGGLTQREAARVVGVDESTVSRWRSTNSWSHHKMEIAIEQLNT